jgi:LPS export ABC transporter protein LptC
MQLLHVRYTICIVFALLFLAACENNMETVNMVTASDKTPLLVESNATVDYKDSGKTRFKLVATQLENYGGTDPYYVCSKGFTIDFYDDSMNVKSHVSADYGIRHDKTKLMEADKNVVLVNHVGDQLNTEQLFWDAGKHIIYTSKYVQIKTATEILFGDGLQSNEDFSNYKITNIKGTVLLNNPKK